MWKAFVSLWKNIFNYSGTTDRKDFWLGSIMNIVAMYVGLVPIAIILLLLKMLGLIHLISPTLFSVVYILIFMIPLFSLYVRRANSVGLKIGDALLVAVATPVVGAMAIGLYPPGCKVVSGGVSWCYRCVAIGFGLFFYGGLILGPSDAALPVVGAGLGLATLSMVIGAIIVKIVEKRNNGN